MIWPKLRRAAWGKFYVPVNERRIPQKFCPSEDLKCERAWA